MGPRNGSLPSILPWPSDSRAYQGDRGGYQSKDGSDRANGRDSTLPNGQKLFLGSSGTGTPYDKQEK